MDSQSLIFPATFINFNSHKQSQKPYQALNKSNIKISSFDNQASKFPNHNKYEASTFDPNNKHLADIHSHDLKFEVVPYTIQQTKYQNSHIFSTTIHIVNIQTHISKK